MKIIIDPYKSTAGMAKDSTELRKILFKFISTTSGLNYEVNTSKPVVFITGITEEEKKLPFFDQPMVIKDIRNRDTTIIDMRLYIKSDIKDTINLKDMCKDKSVYNFQIIRAILTAEFVDGNIGIINPIEKNLCSAFVMFLGNLIKFIVPLNPEELLNMEIAIAHYFYSLTVENDDIENMESSIIARISNTKLSFPCKHNKVTEIVQMIDNKIVNFESLIKNINAVLSEDKNSILTLPSIINNMASNWFGPGNNMALLVGLEHVPTWATLVYSGLTDNSYKRSRMSTVLDRFKNKIDVNVIEKEINNIIKNKTYVFTTEGFKSSLED